MSAANDADECCVCLEPLIKGIRLLPCKHMVHDECYDILCEKGMQSKKGLVRCPLCRKDKEISESPTDIEKGYNLNVTVEKTDTHYKMIFDTGGHNSSNNENRGENNVDGDEDDCKDDRYDSCGNTYDSYHTHGNILRTGCVLCVLLVMVGLLLAIFI